MLGRLNLYLVALFVGLRGAILRMLGRRPNYDLVELRLRADLPDLPPAQPLIALRPAPMSLFEILGGMQEIEKDIAARALLIDMASAPASPSAIGELRRAILRLKKAGTFTAAYIENPSASSLWLASACDRIILPPTASIMPLGLSTSVTFFKGLLDKAGVEADMLRIGEYKNAADMFTRDSISKAHKEAMDALLDDYYEQIESAIAEGRNLDVVELRKVIDSGPLSAEKAKELGLVDATLYRDQVKDYLKQEAKCSAEKISFPRYLRVLDIFADPREMMQSHPRVAIVRMEGDIHGGVNRSGARGNSTIGARTMCQTLRDLREDSEVEAVLVRMDSRGGSALASDLIWRELCLIAEQKPTVVSMGDYAASGGYMISVAAPEIVAEAATVTGSIGVIGGKFVTAELAEKLGVTFVEFSRGKMSGMFSSNHPFSQKERKALKEEIANIYRDFVEKVAAGRNKNVEDIEAAAQGRVWTGRQALERGLVDELGGYRQALARLKTRMKLGEDDPVSYELYPRPRTRLFDLRAMAPNALRMYGALGERFEAALEDMLSFAQYREGEVLALLNARIRLR